MYDFQPWGKSKNNANKQSATVDTNNNNNQRRMKVVGITILRAGASIPDPIPLCMACDLSSYGFFQRQVSSLRLCSSRDWHGINTLSGVTTFLACVYGWGGRDDCLLMIYSFKGASFISSSKLCLCRVGGGSACFYGFIYLPIYPLPLYPFWLDLLSPTPISNQPCITVRYRESKKC
jgi:hypothetical protein